MTTICLISAHAINKCPCSQLSATCFALLSSLLVVFLFKMGPKHNAEGLSSVSKHKKTVMCLMEKTCVLAELGSGVSYSAVW